jgi:hypothetical protein
MSSGHDIWRTMVQESDLWSERDGFSELGEEETLCVFEVPEDEFCGGLLCFYFKVGSGRVAFF